MDYSLLIGIHYCRVNECDCPQGDPKLPSHDPPQTITNFEPESPKDEPKNTQDSKKDTSKQSKKENTKQEEKKDEKKEEEKKEKKKEEKAPEKSEETPQLKPQTEKTEDNTEGTADYTTSTKRNSKDSTRKARFEDEYHSDPEDLRRSQTFKKEELAKLAMNGKSLSSMELEDLDKLPKESPSSASSTTSLGSFFRGHKRALSLTENIFLFAVQMLILAQKDGEQKIERKQSIIQTDLGLPQHLRTPSVSIFQRDEGGMKGVNSSAHFNGEYYFIGIIDILMLYTLRKRGEHAYKSLRFGKVMNNMKLQVTLLKDISSVHPIEYSKRFQHFMSEIIE